MPEDQWFQFVRYVLQRDAPVRDAVPTDRMLGTIDYNTETLSRISEDFEILLDELCFISFIEEKPIEGLSGVVSSDSQQEH